MADPAASLILLHGWLGDVADFDALRRILPESSALSLPGHGGLVLDEASTTEDALADLADRINSAAAGRPFTLVGYSMGGRLAAWLVHLRLIEPDRLVLIAASPGLADPRERQARLDHDLDLAEQLRTGDFRSFLHRWYRQALFGDLCHREDFPALIERRLRRDRRQTARALELLGVGRQPDLSGFRLGLEVLYLAGRRDEKYARIAAGLGDRGVVVAGAGHAVHLEDPATTGRLLFEFWRKT